MRDQVIMQDICFIRADPDRPVYYYCAAAPSVQVTAGNQPDVQLQIFRNLNQPDDLYYATLSLQTQLASSPDAAQRAADASPDIPRDAILLPLQAIACSATLNIPDLIPGQTSKTSLSDQQYCYLSAKLDDDDDILLLASLMRTPASTPIAVSYKIDYLQQLPPATFELEANWDQVYRYLQRSIGFNLLIFSVGIEQTSAQLISEKIVTVKVRDTDPDGHMAQAAAELTQILTSQFFTPVIANEPQQTSPKAGFYLQQVSVENIDQRRLSGKISETTVVQRSLYPQALFAQLVNGTDYQADRAIVKRDLQDDFFAYREVRVSLLSDALDANILLVTARLRYGSNSRQLKFTRDDFGPKPFKEPSLIDPKTGKMLWPVEYDFTVYFNQSIGGVTSVSSGSLQTEMSEVFLDVESLYGRYDFAIEAAQQFDWQRYQSVLVTLRYRHRQQPNSSVSRSFQIDQASPRAHYSVMLPEPDEYQFDVNKTYSAAVNSPHIYAELQEPTGQDVYLFSTLYRQRVLTLSADMDWRRVEMVIVSASYACTPAETLQQVFQFTESDAAPRCFSADQLDPEQMTVCLDIWFTYQPGEGGDRPENVQCSTDANALDLATLS